MKSSAAQAQTSAQDLEAGASAQPQFPASFDLKRALAACIAITEALQAVHQSVELHQAVCPANIRFDDEARAELRNDATAPLAYISPEQTGRMNRGVDYRSDYYSLGVVFYEIMTGRLPFAHGDAMEMVHSHIARQATPPHEIFPQVPPVVGNIIMRLLAKNAEDRYQSLAGLLADLKRCQAELDRTGEATIFSLGAHDVCDRLQIPQKLYGRQAEVGQLLASFNRVATGRAELLLVSGYSGIGKTSLVSEIHKPVVARRGYFIIGKFDQFKRNIPYYALTQAFRDLIRQILTESESRIQEWKAELLQAMGLNGQLMIDAIPDLEYVIGKQPAVPRLGATESQNRFNYVVQNFVGVFARRNQPLVIFLDDLQWADEASLKVIELFMTGLKQRALLVIGSYRDNEVAPGEPLMQTISAVEQQSNASTIHVQPLSEQYVAELIADTVKSGIDDVAPLARLVYRKTLGNPFFVGTFIKNLYNEKLLRFDDDSWHWHIDDIEALQITDNVADLLSKELSRLPEETRHLLTLAACIGNRFDYRTLATLTKKSGEQVKLLLQPGLQAGLIMTPDATFASSVHASHAYRFLHDRVQQAAYAGLAPETRKALHLQIGRLLHDSIPEQEREDRLFDITQQLNAGRALIDSHEEKQALAKLNLQAAKKAKTTVAYETALEHATAGIELIESAGQQSPLHFALQMERIEASFLAHRFQDVERQGHSMLALAEDDAQRGAVYEVQIQSALYQDRYGEAKVLAFQALRMLGIDIPEKVNKLQLIWRLLKIKRLLAVRRPEHILDMPAEQDATELLKQKILGRAVAACYIASPQHFPVVIAEQISITLKSGRYTPDLVWALTCYAMVLIHAMNDVAVAHRLGNLVLALSRKGETSGVRDGHGVRVAFGTYGGILHWRQHLASTVQPLYENYRAGVQVGAFEFGIYSLGTSLRSELVLGRHLPTLLEKSTLALAEAQRLKQKTSSDGLRCNIHFIGALTGANAGEADGWITEENVTQLTLYLWHLFASWRQYLFGDFAAALDSIRESEHYLGSAACMAVVPLHNLYHSLSLCACYDGMDPAQQRSAMKKIRAMQKKLRAWAHHAPMNMLHKWHLVEAERCRVSGAPEAAARHYEAAISGARDHDYLNDQALACELAARFHAGIGKELHARAYMEEAYGAYDRWGAVTKTAQLEQAWPDLCRNLIDRRRLLATQGGHAVATTERLLDMDTIIKASQTLSGEIQFDRLLEKLMRLLIENAGAQKGVLLLQQDGDLTVQARINGDAIELRQGASVRNSADLSGAIINFVSHTREKIVLGDAGADPRFNADPYILQHGPKSVLCIPLQKQSELVGVLYLENNLAMDAFTPQRTELLQILSTQIAISLENAGLYNELEQKIQARTVALRQKNHELSETLQHLEQTQRQLVESAKLASLGALVAGVAHEINTPVGVGVTAASTLSEETEKLGMLYQAGTMKRSDLDHYVSTASTISKLLLSNMDRAAMLIQSFKDVATDQASEERRSFDLKSYIQEVMLNLSPMLRKYGHHVAIDCPDAVTVDSYPGALSQVLNNLVMNALLHAFPEGTVGAMTVSVTQPEEGAIVLRFSDNGRGISADHLTRIFDPFFTTLRGKGGSGLGLSIVHNLVTVSLQGKIEVNSTVGQGTSFVVRFPRNPGKSAADTPAASNTTLRQEA